MINQKNKKLKEELKNIHLINKVKIFNKKNKIVIKINKKNKKMTIYGT